MKSILIILLLYAGHGLTTDHIEFSSQESCESAAITIKKNIAELGLFRPSSLVICTNK